MKIETQSGDIFDISEIVQDKHFKGIYNGLLGTMPIQYEDKPNNKGWRDIVFMGVSYSYSKFKIVTL